MSKASTILSYSLYYPVMLLLCCSGCVQTLPEASKWNVTITNPSGEFSKKYTMVSRRKPQLVTNSGGQISIYNDDNWEDKIVAPTGWLIDIEPAK